MPCPVAVSSKIENQHKFCCPLCVARNITTPTPQEALSGETSTKFALFSGHDTVVAPLLAALGAYDCRWPPYASHVAFELWSKPPGSGGGDGKDGAGRALREDAGASASGAIGAGPRRVLVEGRDDAAAAGQVRWRTEGTDSASPSGDGALGDGQGRPEVGPGEVGKQGIGGGAASGSGEEEAYVRVTFQGQPVTHRIMDCSADPLEG